MQEEKRFKLIKSRTVNSQFKRSVRFVVELTYGRSGIEGEKIDSG